MTVPESQSMAALDKANKIRQQRAGFKRQVKSVRDMYLGRQELATILETHKGCEALERATLWEMLTCVHRMADHQTNRFLMCVNLPANKQIGSLTDRQFEELLSKLRVEGEECDSDKGN